MFLNSKHKLFSAMYGKQWTSSLTRIQDITAGLSLFFNIFLIFLILTKSPKQLGPYKWLMIYISVFEIVYSILDVILVPQHFSHGPIFLTIVPIKNPFFGPKALTILNACYWGCFGASMAVFKIHFVYRFSVLSGSSLRKSFNGWRIWLWLSVPLWYALIWFSTGYFLSSANPSTSSFIEDDIKKLFELNPNEYIYLGPYLYEKQKNDKFIVHWVPFFGLAIISATIVSSIITIIVFAILCYLRINDLVATTTFSARLQSLQRQLFYALVIQTLVPLILMHIPAAIMFAFVFLNIDLGVYSAIVSMTIAIYPAVDPIPTMVIIKNYRTAVLKYLGLAPKKTSTLVSNNMKMERF